MSNESAFSALLEIKEGEELGMNFLGEKVKVAITFGRGGRPGGVVHDPTRAQLVLAKGGPAYSGERYTLLKVGMNSWYLWGRH